MREAPVRRLQDSLCAAANRADPFYDYVWRRGAVAQWRSRQQMVSRRDAGLGHSARWFVPDEAEAQQLERQLLTSKRDLKLGLMSAVHSWRTLTTEQAQAITGDDRVTVNSAAAVRQLYSSELVDVGAPDGFSSQRVTNDGAREWLLRPCRSDAYDRFVAPQLTFPEAIRVTGGGRWLTGGQYDRHNILATEFALRVAEFTNAATVLGEPWSSAQNLLWEGWGVRSPFVHGGGSAAGNLENRADLTLVRRDGLRVAVEITASASGKAFTNKVAKWLRQMSAATIGSQGTVLLFVIAGEPHPKTGDQQALRRPVQRAIQQAVEQHPGVQANRTAERVFVCSWDELFPDRHTLADGFDKLPALAPLGMTRSGPVDRLWEQVNVFDEQQLPYTPDGGLDPLAVVGNMSGILSTPHWVRDTPTQVAGDSVRMMWPDGLPGVTPEHLQRKGPTGNVGFPERVLL